MNHPNRTRTISCFFIILLLAISVAINAKVDFSVGASPIQVTVLAGEPEKHTRENVTLQGNVSRNGLPVTDSLVALEIRDGRNTPLLFRTLTVGTPAENWALEITDIVIRDPSTMNLMNVVKIGTSPFFGVTLRNRQLVDRTAHVTVTFVDASRTPIITSEGDVPVAAGQSAEYSFQRYIPAWATSGLASVICNAYTGSPSIGGVPYTPEKTASLFVSRYEQGTKQYQTEGASEPNLGPGNYAASFHVPPESLPGTYSIYAIARVSPIDFSSLQILGFNLSSNSYPPVASFAYLPLHPYRNMDITFDASFSSAENYNDTITSYAWDWGNGQTNVTTSPTIVKRLTGSASRYLVTLNVTNKEGLWATASKYVYFKPSDPTASFTWLPSNTYPNTNVTFDASASDPGWDETSGNYATITQYKWNFNDGTGDVFAANPAINHSFAQVGNYTVTLTITNNAGLSNGTSHSVSVVNFTLVGDITGPQGVPDGKVDIMDLALVSARYGTLIGQPGWDPRADVNGDGKVDIVDVAIVSGHYGQHL
jgi:PKD repeat protein